MSNVCLIEAFRRDKFLDNDLLAHSRIANIATASLAPLIAALLSSDSSRERTRSLIEASVRAAAISIDRIPELASESILETSMYDIRGTMRGPGGEDHVGCLALVRLAYESDEVARAIGGMPDALTDLCELHQKLKTLEAARGKLIMHGSGVTPKSRRILLSALCHVELKSQNRAGIAKALLDLFEASCVAIASFRGRCELNDEDLFQIAENILDLTSFPSQLLVSVFSSDDALCTACLEVIVNAYNYGIEKLAIVTPHDILKSIQV
jgi:glycine cleavage system regulatory protein